MCEFCVQHGDGQKWYLAMQNYSRELLDEENRLDYIAHFANTFEERVPRSLDQLDLLSRTPLHGPVKPFLTRNQKRDHFGQVVPLEEIEQILSQVDGIARLPCVCRRVTTGQKEARYCFALTGDPRLAEVLDDSFSLEYLSPAEAVESVRELDEKGNEGTEGICHATACSLSSLSSFSSHRTTMNPNGSFEPAVTAFTCIYCAYMAADTAGALRQQYPPMRLVRQACDI